MEFKITKQQEMIKKVVKQFADSKLAPVAAEIDQTNKIPPDIITELKKLKVFGIPFDKKYGGSGMTHTEVVLVQEEIGRASAGAAMILLAHNMAGISINLFGSQEQKDKFLPRLCSGEDIGSLAFTEAATGSDPRAIVTTAHLDGNEYVLNGTKRFVTNAGFNGSGVFFAKTEAGVSCFIVNKSSEGYSISSPWEKMGCRGVGVHDVYLSNVRVPKENLIGQDGDGYKILLRAVGLGKLNICAILLGVGEAALEEAVKYAKERLLRGKPIAGMQTIQSLIADAAARVEASRWMLYRVATLASEGTSSIDYESALAKLFIAEAIEQAVHMSLQVHGSYGYLKEFKIERLYRDARLGEVLEGVSEIQRVIVASKLLS